MKPVVIIALAVGVSVVAVLGVLIGIVAYQQAQLEKEQREANQALINLMQKVVESEQKQSTTPQPAKSTSSPPASVPPTQTKETNCDPSYPDVCIPPLPPDLDCGEIQYRNFKVLPPDPHRFDGDRDGIGCEK